MHFVKKNPDEKRIDLENKLKSKKILRVPGAYNHLTAKVIEDSIDERIISLLSAAEKGFLFSLCLFELPMQIDS